MNEQPDARATAVHEAGHAVVAKALRLAVLQVRLGDLTRHPATQAYVPGQAHFRYDSRTREGRQCHALVCFGGPLAEARYRGLSADDMAPYWAGRWRGDLDGLHKFADVGMFKPLSERAQELVDQNWAAITLVADALIASASGTLSRVDFIKLLRHPRVADRAHATSG
jgi:hypothetical protein